MTDDRGEITGGEEGSDRPSIRRGLVVVPDPDATGYKRLGAPSVSARLEFRVITFRDGDWWMVHVPVISGVTHSRTLGGAELMAREYIAVTFDLPMDSFDVHLDFLEWVLRSPGQPSLCSDNLPEEPLIL